MDATPPALQRSIQLLEGFSSIMYRLDTQITKPDKNEIIKD